MRTSVDLSNLGDELEALAEMLERIEEGRGADGVTEPEEEEEPEE
jgi:hypothetical protein